MPSRTALFELATRGNSYVCRSCLTALGLSQPPYCFTRGYASNSKTGNRSSVNKAAAGQRIPPSKYSKKEPAHQRVKGPPGPDTAKTASQRPDWDPESEPEWASEWEPEWEPDPDPTPDIPPNERPKINYFEKDPRTGEVTPVAEVEDDGEGEPDFEDIRELGRSALDKFKTVDAILGKSDKLDHYLERVLAKHGPPGAIEAFRAALKSYDEPEDNESKSVFNVEEDSNANVENVMGSLMQAVSESKYDDMPELKDAAHAFKDALQSLTDGSKGKDVTKEATNNRLDAVPRPDAAKRAQSLDYYELPSVDFSGVESGFIRKELSHWVPFMQRRLKASLEAIGSTYNVRKWRDDKTYSAYSILVKYLYRPDVKVHKMFWGGLWTIFSHKGRSNPLRLLRIKSLTEAMRKIGAKFSDNQKVLGIEALFETGSEQYARDWWTREVTVLGHHEDSALAISYWEIGVRMWCAAGDLKRAERACKNLLERVTPSRPTNSRVLLHLVEAYCQNPETAEKGFTFYRRMRDFAAKIEKPFEIEDYDDVVSVFLSTGHTDYAMFAFTDMMFAGSLNLKGQSKLPSQVRNHFFFGKWLKRLIGARDLQGAYNVLVFMQRNGVMAASVQVNGLIGAWLRNGTVKDRGRAYDLAWAMIASRKAFVDLRKREALVDWPIYLHAVDQRSEPSGYRDNNTLEYGLVPRATVETFVILAGEYREQSRFEKLEELFVAYKECEMPNDAMMMNELIAAAVAQKMGHKARELYELMVHEHDIMPSTDTFAILFSSLPANVARVPLVNPSERAESMHQARAIFGDMMRSAWVYSAKTGRRGLPNALSQSQAKLCLHSFRKVGDWAGVMVALIGLRDVMRYQLTRGVMLEMIEGRENMDRPSPRTAKMVVRATLRLDTFVEQLQRQGALDAHMTPEGMKDWRVLYDILLSFYDRKLRESADEQPELLIRKAKEDMGLAEERAIKPTDVD